MSNADASDGGRSLFVSRGVVRLPGPPRRPDYRRWLYRFGETRPDVLVEESLIEYLDSLHRGTPPTATATAEFRILDLLAASSLDEAYEELEEDVPTELWHALQFLERQRWGDEGHLAESNENIFHLSGRTLLSIEGSVRQKGWRVSVADFAERTRRLRSYTRFFRCVRAF